MADCVRWLNAKQYGTEPMDPLTRANQTRLLEAKMKALGMKDG